MIEKFKTNAEVIENGDKYLYGNHVRMPISMERGEGVYVFDKDGNKYLDFVGGIAVNGLGHCHPAIVKCLQERAETILHCSNYFYNEPAVQTAKLIVENSCFDKVLFANSGAEANEGQIKLARKYAKDHGHPERFVVITMKNSFHGRTLATCTATGQYAVHRYFEPLPSGFRYAEFNNLQSVKDIMDEYVCAISRKMGEYFRKQAHEIIEKNHPETVNEIRGLGLIDGIQLNKPSGQPVVDLCFKDSNVLINNTNGNVLRFVPPLIVNEEEIDIVIKAVDEAMTKLGW